MYIKAKTYMAKENLNTDKSYIMLENTELHAIAEKRMLTTSEAENILNRILADGLFQINLN